MSSFAWLDYAEHDRRLALDVIDQFREQDTRDELGLGALRDGFADLLFPGTGTVQTRPRYFLFVAWTYQALERKKASSAEIRAKARKAEIELIEVLLEQGGPDGVIGRFARTGLKRLPSNIYWQGLGALGILRFKGSQDQYHRSLDDYYRRGGLDLRADDNELANRVGAFNWAPSIPKPPRDFPRSATLDLTSEEAEFIRERVAYERPDSLLRFLLDQEHDPPEAGFPWALAVVDSAPERLQEQLLHARNLSETTYGAALLYNLILARLRTWDEKVALYEEQLDAWVRDLELRRPELADWNRRRFWEIAESTGAMVTPRTRAFVDAWVDFATGPNAASVRTSRAAEALVCNRERALKRKQARVDNARARDVWNGASGTRRLTYRWEVTQRLLTDVYDGRQAADA